MTEGILLCGIALVSALLQSVTGFGFGIVLMALVPLFLPYEIALGLSTILGIALNTSILIRCWRHIDWKQLWLPLIFGLIGATAGVLLLKNSPPAVYKRALGIFLLLLSVWFFFFSDRVRLKANLRNAGIAGAISGICGGLFSVNGPPMVLYFVSVIEDKQRYQATLQAYFLLNAVWLLSLRLLAHQIPAGIGTLTLWSLAGLIVGSIVGGKIFNRIDGAKLKRFIYLFMAVAGLWIAIKG